MPGVDIRPFHAMRFDGSRVELDDVVAPPYDVIDDERRSRLMQRSPYNVAGLILPEPGSELRAAERFASWVDEGIIVRERQPCMYWLQQHATGPDGVRRERAGMIAALRLQPYSAEGVRRHELTMTEPVRGRTDLLRTMHANLSPIFMGYADPERMISRVFEPLVADLPPLWEATDDEGTTHRLWRVCESGAWASAIRTFRGLPITIIDGHHRYEAALAYQAERRAADGDPSDNRRYDFAPVYLANRHDPGLGSFATHRVVTGVEVALWNALPELLGERWDLRPVATIEELERLVVGTDRSSRTFGLVRGGTAPLLHATLRDPAELARAAPTMHPVLQRLDVNAVGVLVLRDVLGFDAASVATTRRIAYRNRATDAAALVAAQPAETAIALLVPAPTVSDVEAAAEAEQTMPPKSTFFYPKILDGMVFHSLDD